MATVSVVMPVYNTERFVGEAIESILNQTYRDFEFIIINDGSTDGTLDILRRYAASDSRIHLVSRGNRGITRTRNEALHLATGEYLAMMDSDDVSVPHRLERQVEYLNAHPECVLVESRVLMIDVDGDPIRSINLRTTHEEIVDANLRFGEFHVSNSYMLRREALAAIGGFREDIEVVEDRDMYLRMAAVGRLANIPEELYWYRQHGRSTCSLNREKVRQCADRVVAEARERLGLPPETLRTGKNKRGEEERQPERTWAWQALRAGHVATARKYAWRYAKEHPWDPRSWRLLACSLRGH